jgi:hypothetical protein
VSARRLRPVFFAAIVLAVALAALPSTAQTPLAQADMGAPGGIAALPSSIPAIPGVADQDIPAIIGSGQYAIVVAFCFHDELPAVAGECPDIGGDDISTIQFEMEEVYPTSGPPAASFASSGTAAAVVADNGEADMDAATGVVAVQVDAGSENEVVKVTASDETGDSRSVDIVVVDTILAWGPTGAVTYNEPVFISYHCDVTGSVPLEPLPAAVDPDSDGLQGLDDMYDGYYTAVFDGIGPGDGYGSNTLLGDVDLPDTWCGADTGESLLDAFAEFQTDLGSFSIASLAAALGQQSSSLWLTMGYFYPPVLDSECAEGKNVDVYDVDALSTWEAFLIEENTTEGGCDLDGWRNTVVTTEVWPAGDVGVATITAEQGGGVTLPRTINVTFVGPPNFLVFLTGPQVTNPDRNPFTVVVVDQDGRPVPGEVVECETSPPSAPFGVDPPTATTGPYSGMAGQAVFDPGLVAVTADIVAGEEFDLTCVVQSDPGVSNTVTVAVPLWWGVVGGIAGLPDPSVAWTQEPGAPSDGSGWSAGDSAALAAGLAAAVLALTAGAWYARRRWLK